MFVITLRRKIVQRSSFVVVIVGVGEVFVAESQVPSWGGGMSFGSEFGPTPTAFRRNTESCTIRCPPAFVPEKPSAFRSTSACETVAWQSGQAPT